MAAVRKRRVVLYNPRAVFFTMPLALVALGSAIASDAVEVVIIDGRLERDPIARVLAETEDALCFGVTVLTGAPIRDALAVSRAVKAQRPDCPIIWGGWHPSLFPHECLEDPAVDAVVVGQGEDALRAIVRGLLAGEEIDSLRAPASARQALTDLNQFPPHDYSLIPVEQYFERKGKRQLDYISSQGCRFRCSFCADPAVFARGWSGLLPERIAEEAAQLTRDYAIQEMAFQDETFFTNAARTDALAEEFLRRDLRLDWTATLRADQACRLGAPLFAKVVRSGLRRVMVGVEAGSQSMLDRLNKDLRLEQVIQAAELCAAHNVGAIFNFIVGFPGEDNESIDATLALAKRLRSMHASFDTPIFYYRPYPGNPIADEALAHGYQFPRGLEQWADFDYVGGRGPWVDAERWRHVERFKFYVRHAWNPGVARWPLRKAARWRCERDWYDYPIEKALVELVRPPQQVS